ncbi:DMT family transporter [Pararhizobium sp. YC-54]|uniref:DMT family transporter n=1 Tax=Pararhizobium sp. YC-54 TaxID=2986920 RepID=UPI0021F783E6|nr:DMT family transporter [Pararhizobium sp. YC-54]MCV9999243.1 DMT family transporter [Pararhizobium sp. YC-54]
MRQYFQNAPAVAAVVIMLTGMFLFTANDALGKWLTGHHSIGQLVFLRSLMAFLTLLPFAYRAGFRRIFSFERPWLFLFRVLMTVIDTFAFYYAVSLLPLADVMTYWLAAPLYVAALSPLLLGEHVGLTRWCAIGFGFLGVIVALEPTTAMFTPAAVVSLLGSMAFGLVLISARSLRAVPGISMIFWQTFGGVVVGLLVVPTAWETPTSLEWPLFAALGMLAMLAHVAVNWAFKLADASIVAPFQYTQLFWAIIFGWLVFGDFPSAAKLVGAATIVASGLFIFLRERHVKSCKERDSH